MEAWPDAPAFTELQRQSQHTSCLVIGGKALPKPRWVDLMFVCVGEKWGVFRDNLSGQTKAGKGQKRPDKSNSSSTGMEMLACNLST